MSEETKEQKPSVPTIKYATLPFDLLNKILSNVDTTKPYIQIRQLLDEVDANIDVSEGPVKAPKSPSNRVG